MDEKYHLKITSARSCGYFFLRKHNGNYVNKNIILRIGSLRYTNIHHLENLRFEWTSVNENVRNNMF